MRFRGLFVLVAALTTLGSWARAADQQSSEKSQAALVNPDATSQPDELNSEFSLQLNRSDLKPETTDSFIKPRENAAKVLPSRRYPGTPIDAEAMANRDLCYTLRTYMVRPSERLSDNESWLKGYSSCQLASTYRVRSADAPAKPRMKLK